MSAARQDHHPGVAGLPLSWTPRSRRYAEVGVSYLIVAAGPEHDDRLYWGRAQGKNGDRRGSSWPAFDLKFIAPVSSPVEWPRPDTRSRQPLEEYHDTVQSSRRSDATGRRG